MSEEEIINICESLWFSGEFFGIYYKKDEVDSLAEKGIQGLLDLYNKEKKETNRLREENNQLKLQLQYAINTNNKDILKHWRKK